MHPGRGVCPWLQDYLVGSTCQKVPTGCYRTSSGSQQAVWRWKARCVCAQVCCHGWKPSLVPHFLLLWLPVTPCITSPLCLHAPAVGRVLSRPLGLDSHALAWPALPDWLALAWPACTYLACLLLLGLAALAPPGCTGWSAWLQQSAPYACSSSCRARCRRTSIYPQILGNLLRNQLRQRLQTSCLSCP